MPYYDSEDERKDLRCRLPSVIDEEDDERMRCEAAAWNKKAAALLRPITMYSTQLEEVQAKIKAIKKTKRVDVSLLTEKQKLQEKYNMYLSFRDSSQDLARAYTDPV